MPSTDSKLGAPFDIRVFGPLEVRCAGKEVVLPQSRKTRALLAFLAVSGRPQRRERLCEMFWEVPDDPRGALRWSLSKLRAVLGDVLDADHDTVSLSGGAVQADYQRVKEALAADLRRTGLSELEELATLFRGPFLEDLALPRCPAFESWRIALANEAELMHLRLRRT